MDSTGMQRTALAMLDFHFQGFQGISPGQEGCLVWGSFRERSLLGIIRKGVALSGIGITVPQVIPGKVEQPGQADLLFSLQEPWPEAFVLEIFIGIHVTRLLYPTSPPMILGG
jgi:hypothetical protein